MQQAGHDRHARNLNLNGVNSVNRELRLREKQQAGRRYTIARIDGLKQEAIQGLASGLAMLRHLREAGINRATLSDMAGYLYDELGDLNGKWSNELDGVGFCNDRARIDLTELAQLIAEIRVIDPGDSQLGRAARERLADMIDLARLRQKEGR